MGSVIHKHADKVKTLDNLEILKQLGINTFLKQLINYNQIKMLINWNLCFLNQSFYSITFFLKFKINNNKKNKTKNKCL